MGQIGASAADMADMGSNATAGGGGMMKKFGKMGIGGLSGGLQNYDQVNQQQGQGGGPQIQMPQAPQVDPSYFQPNKFGYAKGPKPNGLFFGGVT